jgi:FkbM family methyltransferase
VTEQDEGASRGLSKAQSDRASFFDAAPDRSEYLTVRVDGALFLVKTEDQHVGRALYIKGGRGDIKLLARTLRAISALYGPEAIDGRTFLDVGANIGTTTVSALLFHPLGRAVALEPEPKNFVTLRLNLLLNGLAEKVTAIPAAASSSVGTVELLVNPTSSGLHSVLPDELLRSGGRKGTETSVPSVTLDSLAHNGVAGVEETALIWIDAEHHEGSILRGAVKFGEAGVPVLLEWDPEGLAPRGEDVAIEEVAGEYYTHFLDMRGGDDSGRKLEVRPVDALVGYTHPAHTGEGTHFTELLFLRLTKAQAASADDALRAEKSPPRETEASTLIEAVGAPSTGKQLLQQVRATDRLRRRKTQRGRKQRPPESG